jgi:hypothetical protein
MLMLPQLSPAPMGSRRPDGFWGLGAHVVGVPNQTCDRCGRTKYPKVHTMLDYGGWIVCHLCAVECHDRICDELENR